MFIFPIKVSLTMKQDATIERYTIAVISVSCGLHFIVFTMRVKQRIQITSVI